MDIFTLTMRPRKDVFFSRNDPNDRRLGEHTAHDPAGYADAQVVILGCPQDEGVRRNGGRVGAALAPEGIRRALYRLTVNGVEALRLFDLGDTLIGTALEETHARQQQVVEQVIADGKTLVSLGGGNDISYPDCAGLSARAGALLAFNVDAHYDVRADATRHSGTPYRQLLEEGLVEARRFYEIGAQPFANSPVYTHYLRERGVTVITREDVRRQGIETVLETLLARHSDTDAMFWGLDMDVVRASDAPGVSAPNPTGLFGEELCAAATLAGRDLRSRVLELTEVNPIHDVDGRTCRLAAAVIYHFLAGRCAAL